MKKSTHKKQIVITVLAVIIVVAGYLIFADREIITSGLTSSKETKNTTAIDFTVVSGTDILEDLQKMLDSRQEKTFELSYSDQDWLYIAKGYGKQPTDGYNIVVNDFYKADDELVFDTELFGPKSGEPVSDTQSYPYIVIKTEYRSESIVFQ